MPPPAATTDLPVPVIAARADVERHVAEVTEDRRAERRLLLLEALAILAVALLIVVRALWLS